MPDMEVLPKPELYAWHDISVELRFHLNLANVMPGMKSSPATFSVVRAGTEFFSCPGDEFFTYRHLPEILHAQITQMPPD